MAIPGELIPLAAIGVGLVAVMGRVIVQPIVQAVMKLSEQRHAPAAQVDVTGLTERLAALEEQNQRLERSLDRLLADREFLLQLQAGKQPPVP